MRKSQIDGSRAVLNLTHDGTTENFQRYKSELPDGTILTVYVPRANFVHVMGDMVNGRGQNLSEIVMYQSRALVQPSALFIEPDPAPVPRRKKSTTTSRRKK